MRNGGGKQKGSKYERLCCERLSLWQSNLLKRDLFWRSAMSGGRANLRSRKKTAKQFGSQAGDLTATDKQGLLFVRLFCVDVKHHADFKIDRVPFARKSKLEEVWRDIQGEARKFGKMPMLILKQNNRGEILVVDQAGADAILLKEHRIRPTMVLPRLAARVYLLQDVLGRVRFDAVRKKHLKERKRGIKRLRLIA